MKYSSRILSVIVFAQFCCTSIWFASTAVAMDLVAHFEVSLDQTGDLISCVQFGFIVGTLLFAVFNISDRFSPSRVFFISALMGAGANISVVFDIYTWDTLLISRFISGIALAGIYPVGIKIAADHFGNSLGKSLGYLVGALVLGSACPYFIRMLLMDYPWQNIIFSSSALDILGALLILILVPDGQYRVPAKKVSLAKSFLMFRDVKFKSAAFGYFGHMWELYSVWTFVPIILMAFQNANDIATLNIPLWSFVIIGIGCFSCILGGHLSLRFGAARVAYGSLFSSLLCIVIFPFLLWQDSIFLFLGFMMLWGFFVVMDSPMFSVLIAKYAEPSIRGSAITIVTCIGFALTILSIKLFQFAYDQFGIVAATYLLLIGPIAGLLSRYKYSNAKEPV